MIFKQFQSLTCFHVVLVTDIGEALFATYWIRFDDLAEADWSILHQEQLVLCEFRRLRDRCGHLKVQKDVVEIIVGGAEVSLYAGG